MAESAVARLERTGPGGKGLEPCSFITPAGIVEGTPKESFHNFFIDATGQMTAGVWECTPCTTRFDANPADEYCHILSGRVVIADEAGNAQSFGPGESFVVPKGFRGSWHMPETTRKYYVIFECKG